MMLLICEDDKPLGYYENKGKEGDGSDPLKDKSKEKDKEKDKKGKEKDKKVKVKSKKNKGKSKKMDDSYYDEYFNEDYIKLALGKKMRKGINGAIESKKNINFEIFKDELEC
jgi:hypothetical protein